MNGEVRVKGLSQLIKAADAAGKQTKKAVRERLRQAAGGVKAEAEAQMSDIGPRFRFGVSVRRSGVVSVEERLRRTTGKRPDYGALQMRRALLPALSSQEDEIERELQKALDDIADIFERGH